MPKHVQTYLDGYNVRVAAMNPDEKLTDTSVDVELVFISEDTTDTITVPIPSDIRPKLAAYLVGMEPPPDPAQAMADAKAAERPPDIENADQEPIAEPDAAPAGRCSRCGARGVDERVALCPNAALIQVGDVGAIEGFAESGCAAAIATFDDIAQADPVERADINDEPNGDGV